jgi:hypothetical protein
VAWTLVYEHDIPAVVAMQYEITNEQALIFARSFYQQLARGRPIDEAVREGREALGQQEVGRHKAWGDRSFATPVTYLCSEKAIVEPQEEQPERTPRDAPPRSRAAGQKVPCPNPICIGWVLPGYKKCLGCNEALAECPRCHNPMVVRLHACAICLYAEASVATAAAMGATPVLPAPREAPSSSLEAPTGIRMRVRDPRLSN